ncbi:hypothetical protein MUU72_32635 [Streptomyces sp. RS10V-4]|uniref:hypothetical protein n=1 Tax=Streptomyces rhizoryzae TaxID=2932493 RepID=UPI0020039C55|nr:hypothetical protein [Streptomyces rhizoryzae]MCK7627787.1 hypothetical protein [Streptomyces rhizoryzae]
MALITEYTVTAEPDRCLVEVYDSDAYLQDSAALEAAREQVVAGNGYHLYLHSLQPAIGVDVIIRVWDEPQSPPTHCEGSVPVTIESTTACLVINQLTFGPAGTMDLPRPGVYEGIAWWTGRHATLDYYNRALVELAERPDTGNLEHVWRNNPTPERYVLDLHYARESSPDDEDAA